LQEIDGGASTQGTLSELISKSMDIASPDGANFTYSLKEAAQVFVNHLEDVFEAKETGGTGLKTGIKSLDEAMGFMHAPDLVVVGARPGVGKTAFALSVLRNVAKTGKRVGFFSTEMSVTQVMSRFYSLESGINAHKLRYADFDDQDYAKLSATTEIIKNLNFEICDKPSITVGELAMQARAWAANGGIDFIAIDYLTRLKPSKSHGNQNLDMGSIATELKNLARTLNIPVLVLAQLNRGVSNRADNRPRMSDLRDSGIIEQEADQILLLHRPEEGAPEVIVDKNRHGMCGAVRCLFDPSTMRWADFDDDYNYGGEA
jgi:replicative DNA helicase